MQPTTYFFHVPRVFLILKKVRRACTLATEFPTEKLRHMLHRRQSVDPVGPKHTPIESLYCVTGKQVTIACNQSERCFSVPSGGNQSERCFSVRSACNQSEGYDTRGHNGVHCMYRSGLSVTKHCSQTLSRSQLSLRVFFYLIGE